MRDIVFLNGVDVTDLGLMPTAAPGWSDAARNEFNLQTVPGRRGRIPSRMVSSPERYIEIHGMIHGDTWQERSKKLDDLTGYCAGQVDIRFGDRPDRFIIGAFEEARTAPTAPGAESLPGAWWNVVLRFVCPDPVFYAVEESEIVGIGSSPTVIPMGTLPSAGVLTISGGTNPVIRGYRSNDELIGEMTFSGDFTGNTLTVDFLTRELSTSLAVNPWSLWAGLATERFLTWSVADYDFRAESWPKISVSSGSGSYAYRKAYLR